MVLPAVLVAITVAFVVVTSVVGRARNVVSVGVGQPTTVEQDTPKVVASLNEMYAQDELLRLKRETLEATGVSSQQVADLLRDIENAIENKQSIDSIARDDLGAQGGAT